MKRIMSVTKAIENKKKEIAELETVLKQRVEMSSKDEKILDEIIEWGVQNWDGREFTEICKSKNFAFSGRIYFISGQLDFEDFDIDTSNFTPLELWMRSYIENDTDIIYENVTLDELPTGKAVLKELEVYQRKAAGLNKKYGISWNEILEEVEKLA